MKWLAAIGVACVVMMAGATMQAGAAEATEAIAVESSAIDTVAYNEETQVMTVKFDKGGTYEYAAVPKGVYDALMASDSKGQYFDGNIRGKFAATKVSD
jgi:lysyl-tRNA synthetase class 2